MQADENGGIAERSPEAVLDFWLGRLRSPADASRENWQEGMLKWRMGPFARGAENPSVLQVQRDWCERMHRDGLDRFFRDPVWDTPKGFLAKLIVLDQFPRSVYRGTALGYANDCLTAPLSWKACESGRDFAEYNVIERFWIYVPLAHAEDLKLQELSIEKMSRWSVDLIADVPPHRRRINQFVSWSIVKGAIEHSEALLLFDRFPHRNVVLQRPHRGGEPRYLTDAMRPLWSFTQVPDPDYFAVLGALYRTGNGLDENRIARDNLAALLRAAGVSPDDPTAPMDIFDLVGDDVVPYPPLYRHLRLPEHAGTLDILRRMPLVIELTNAVKSLILKDGDLTWPPRSVKHSLETAINVAGLNALVRGGRRSGSTAGKIADGSGRRGGDDCEPPSELTLSLTVRNDGRELERVSAAVDGFADRHRFPQQDRFQVQLCIEEILVYIVEHGYDDAGTHRIEVQIEMSDEDRRLEIRTVDDGRELAPGSFMFQPGPDTIQEESVVDGLGFHLVRTYVDELKYRHENGRNYLSLTKRIGS